MLLDCCKGRAQRVLIAAVAAILSLPAIAQQGPGEYTWIEPTTPVDEALRRGILASPLEEGAPFAAGVRNPMFERLKRIPSAVSLDNAGQRFTGQNRIGIGLNVNNPLGLGDRLGMGGTTDMESGNAGLWLVNLSYAVPVGPFGTRAGVNYFHFDYKVGKEFAALQAHGDGNSTALFFDHPLVRSHDTNLFVTTSYGRKNFRDFFDAIAVFNDRTIRRNWHLGAIGDLRDGFLGGGLNAFSLEVARGDLNIGPAIQLAADQSPTGLRTQGVFRKTLYGLSRLQRITDNASLLLSVRGQLASKNLASVEKFSLGGAGGVRAFPAGEALSDEGILFRGEARYLIPGFDLLGARLAVLAFYDWGHVTFNRKPRPSDDSNGRTISGHGFGAFLGKQEDFFARLSIAWRGQGGQPQADTVDRHPRIWLQLAKWF